MPKPDALVVRLGEVRKDDIPLVGGRCANLGELTAKGRVVGWLLNNHRKSTR
ncbi:MAG TPA: hypothetical protein VFE96_08270 [Candidatus Bathyarchaeia archaeon]|nr:hypothetical protein [Candidatus Bathyarchaeia archaeon]